MGPSPPGKVVTYYPVAISARAVRRSSITRESRCASLRRLVWTRRKLCASRPGFGQLQKDDGRDDCRQIQHDSDPLVRPVAEAVAGSRKNQLHSESGLEGADRHSGPRQDLDYAGVIGLRIILDHHTNDGGGGQQPNGLWFDKGPGTDGTDGAGNGGTVTAADFQSDTLALAARYKNNPTVIGFDLDNEPLSHGKNGVSLNWGQGGPTDIWQMYTTVGNALLKLNKHWLIICEGPQAYSNTGNGIAGVGPEADLSPVGGIDGVPTKPVVLIRKHQVVYSVHEYGTAIDDFKANEHPATLIAHMNRDWGYLYTKNIAPVWVGELGSSLDTPEERTWAQTVVDYLNGKDGAQGGPVFTGNQQPVSSSWWCWGYLPGEAPDGTLESDWVTPKPSQQVITNQLMARLKGQ